MKEKEFTLSAKILMSLFLVAEFLPKPFESKSSFVKRRLFGKANYWSYYMAMRRLEKRGLITILKDKESKFVKLTSKGQLEAIFLKAKDPGANKSWDGTWSLVLFDIPEDAREKRAVIRRLLMQLGFVSLQKSVYISPRSLNREAVEYLKKVKLLTYIRILKVAEMDDDTDLRKRFNLS